MPSLYSESLDRTIEVNRIIGRLNGTEDGPTVIFFGGLHGNESSGVFALHQVLEDLRKCKATIKGNVIAISGNLNALQRGERYFTEDLNRIWTHERLEQLMTKNANGQSKEIPEQAEIYSLVQQILKSETGPFYFLDLHSTSSNSVPFVIVNDSLLNRKFAQQYPVPMILGIEEYIDGPMLSYFNDLGYVSFGYEAGQHDDLDSYENQIAFIYVTLIFAGSLDKNTINFHHFYERLAKAASASRDIYEIHYRFKVKDEDEFVMHPGYVNFQKILKGQKLATRNGEEILASHTGRVFMPLYQDQGKEGFFEIRIVRPIFLRLSAILRKTKFAHILPLLPGIRWKSRTKDTLIVNLKIARFFTKQFLHLLGYRSKRIDKTHLVVKNREASSKVSEYEGASWIK